VAQKLRVEEVAMQYEFLADAVMQHLRHLEAVRRRANLIGDTLADHLHGEGRMGKVEGRKWIGAARINARRIIICARPIEPRRGRSDQPPAFVSAGEARDGMDDRARGEEASRNRGRL